MDTEFHLPERFELSTNENGFTKSPPAMHTYHRAGPPPSHTDLTIFAPRYQYDATFFLLLEQAIAAVGSCMGLIQLIGSRDVVVVTSYNVDELPSRMSRVEAGLVTLQSIPTLVQENYHEGAYFVRIPLMLSNSCIGTLEVASLESKIPSTSIVSELTDIASTAALAMQNTAIESQHFTKKAAPSRWRQHRGNSTSTTSTSSMYSAESHRDVNDSTCSSNVSDSPEGMMEALLTMSKQTASLLRETKERMHCDI